MSSWKKRLADRIPEKMGHELQAYEANLDAKRSAAGLGDQVFNELRLRRGVYGQRYDNGRRHDGKQVRELPFPSGSVMKGTGTFWDAPGMQRIKLPYGRLTPDQMDALADIAEEYADEILHITTRQDVQLHFVHIDDTPDMMRRLAAVGITTKEACGNVVRNITACPRAGVCNTESFDVSPYAEAVHEFMLGHPDGQNFGRKFKITFSGCREEACGLVGIHDAGGIARVRTSAAGEKERGFEFYVGGGLGAVPHRAQLFDEFLPEAELLPTLQAMARVFGRHGEKDNRARARLKFLIARIGLEEFIRLVHEERASLSPDPRWDDYLEPAHAFAESPIRPASEEQSSKDADYLLWHRHNVRAQAQHGYAMATVHLPLGDLSSWQMRSLAKVCRDYVGDHARATVEQNIVLRWVPMGDLPGLYAALRQIGLALPGADSIVDIVACPGTDTCKLGVASSRGLAGELRSRLAERMSAMDAAVSSLRIKVSGCFNSCGQHHIADIGFWGVSRAKKGRKVPHFQLVLGGQRAINAESYGLAVGAAPAKNIPDVVDRVLAHFLEHRQRDESFQTFVGRIGKMGVRKLVDDLMKIPDFDAQPEYYSDWGDPRTFTTGDIGVGECAGEMVATIDFDLEASEREVFNAMEKLDGGDATGASQIAFQAMVSAARALVKLREPGVSEDPASVHAAFHREYYLTKDFFDPFAKAKFANYYYQAHDELLDGPPPNSADEARRRIDEAQLFVEAAHSCYARMSQEGRA